MKKLIRCNEKIPILNEVWRLYFHDYKPLDFETKEDLEKYLNGEFSNAHGYMEYERIPCEAEHIVHYDIDWGIKEGEL